jgi:hypothetical protein
LTVGGAVAGAGLFVGAGLALAAWLGGQALVDSRAPARVVTVKGLAEREVEADVAAWRIPFRGEGATQEQAIAAATRARDAVRAFAAGGGVAASELSEEPFVLKVDRVFVDNGASERLRFTAAGAIRLRTANVAAVSALAARTLDLLSAGVLIGEGDYAEAPRPLYGFTRINEIKPGMIADATRSAREAAAQFAADSGAEVGDIVTANQGVVQFLARDGDFDERFERHKIIRVVSTVDYRLVD